MKELRQELIDKLKEEKRTFYEPIINDLANQGISFYENEPYSNVVFEKDGDTYEVYQELFYRVSGPCAYTDEKTSKTVQYEDKDFYLYWKLLVQSVFNK